jgi:hypothetical protein
MVRRAQIKVRPGKPLVALLRATGGDRMPTMRLNAVSERYLAMIEAARPQLEENEWFAVCDANNGYGMMEEINADSGLGQVEWNGIWVNVYDTPELGEKWGIDETRLVQRLRDMSSVERIAVAETIQRFWAYSRIEGHAALRLACSHPATWPADVEPDNAGWAGDDDAAGA